MLSNRILQSGSPASWWLPDTPRVRRTLALHHPGLGQRTAAPLEPLTRTDVPTRSLSGRAVPSLPRGGHVTVSTFLPHSDSCFQRPFGKKSFFHRVCIRASQILCGKYGFLVFSNPRGSMPVKGS